MNTTTYQLTTDDITDTIVVTVDGDDTVVRFFTDGVETSDPSLFESGSGHLREYLQDCVHAGYRLV